VTVAATMRRDRDETTTLLTGVGRLFSAGVGVDWTAVLAGRGGRRIDLPTYPFQHERYWVNAGAAAGDVTTAGLDVPDHPLLGAAVWLADSDGVVLTGRLSVDTQPWLADHRIGDTILFPGTGFVELALHAGRLVGCDTLAELTLSTPLVLPDHGGVAVQVTVGAPGDDGSRRVSVHSRPEGTGPGTAWTLHADGLLGGTTTPAGLSEWPPAGAVAIDLDGGYAELADLGYAYGETYQGVRSLWRRGEEIFAEVALPASAYADAARFGLHPALLDAALHAQLLAASADGPTVLPFAWSGVAVHAVGATTLRVRIVPAGPDTVALTITDGAGEPVLTVTSLTSRPVDMSALAPAAATDALFRVDWVPVAAPDTAPVDWRDWSTLVEDESPETVVLVDAAVHPDDLVADAHARARRALDVLRRFLDGPRFARTRLVVLTTTGDVAAATVRGLVRAAQAEQPDRIVLVETDAALGDLGTRLGAVLATGEPEVRVAGADLLVRRLARAAAAPTTPVALDGGTVLVTGGTGGLGAVVARHLATAYGVRHLLLTSRRGPAATGAADLVAELAELGARVEVVACDVSDRTALAALIAAVPDERPLVGVVHTAGVLDDGVVTALTPERLDAVLAPKVDAAVHLDALTAGRDLAMFVLFSSIAGVLGGPGQANYAAANAFLDELAAYRRSAGRSAHSIAWGPWDGGGMAGELGTAERQRMRRSGIGAFTPEQGLALLDAAVSRPEPSPVAAALDLRALAGAGDALPPVLRSLAPAARRQAGSGDAAALRRRLLTLAPRERDEHLLELVRAQVAAVLGHASADAVAPERAFQELGFDSLSAVELRNRLNAVTGLRLPATLVFDYPNARAVADEIAAGLLPETGEAGADADRENQVRQVLAGIPLTRLRDAGLLDVLLELGGAGGIARDTDTAGAAEPAGSIDDMDAADLISLALGGFDLNDASEER
jgi:NADP-dependent 3-hydroxy acid dehydrogenase YdfG/acyl carrier protein